MMQAADLRNGNDRALSTRFDCSWDGRVLIKTLMGPGIMIVAKIFLQNPSEMFFRNNNYMVETLLANTTDRAFRVCILPGRVGSGDHFFDLHSSYPPLKIVPVDRISVSQQEAWSRVFRKRLDHLPRRPGSGRMFRDIEMDDLTPLVQEDDKAVKVTEGRGGDGKEIDADDVACVIGKESLPRLGGRLGRFDSVFCDGRFSHLEP